MNAVRQIPAESTGMEIKNRYNKHLGQARVKLIRKELIARFFFKILIEKFIYNSFSRYFTVCFFLPNVQISKAFDASVTAVCSTTNIEMVKSIGADSVIDYTTEDFKLSNNGLM